MRYIDADVLWDLIDGGYDIDFSEVPETKKALLHMIDYQETADVVKVLRCKDCRYWHELLGICKRRQPLYGYGINDYCSKGEEKKDDAEI